MKVRHHYTYEDLWKMNSKFSDEEFKAILEKMCQIGILEYDYGDHYDDNGPIPNTPHIRRYVLPMFVPGSAEFTNMVKNKWMNIQN